MSQIYNSVQPEALKDAYREYDTIDFVLTFENQSLVLDTLKLEGVIELDDPANSYVDSTVGIHSIIDTITVDFQNEGNVQNLTEYPHWVRMYSDVNYQGDDYYNSHLLSELRTGGRDYGAGLFNKTTKQVSPDFCFKPLICLNQSVGPNKLSGFSKSGAVSIRIRLNRNVNVLYGEKNESGKSYTVSNLKLSYITVEGDSKEPVQMRTYVQLKQVLDSQLTNINTRVPAICDGVACTFIDISKLNDPVYNQLQTEGLPSIDEVVFMFNDSTNTYITYPLRTPEEIALHYYESLNETGHTALSTQRSVNNYGIGLKFMDFIDLRNQKFNIQIKSSVNKAYQMYMSFTSILSI